MIVRDSSVMLAFGVNAPNGNLELRDPEIHFIHFGEKAEFKRSHAVSIAIDDSIKFRPGTRYRSALTAGNALVEDVAATLSRDDLKRIATATRVTIQLSELKLEMTSDQTRSVQLLLDQLAGPVSNRQVANNCAQRSVTYFEFQVEKPAAPTNHGTLVYPQELTARAVEGSVLAQFVVTEDGLPEIDTFKVLETSDELFATAVKNNLPNMRFTPAEIGSKKVRQLVQMPFVFRLASSTRDSIKRAPNLLPGAVVRRGDTTTITLPSGVMLRRVVGRDSSIMRAPTAFSIPASASQRIYKENEVDKAVRNPDGKPLPKKLPSEVVEFFGGEQLLEFVVNADGGVASGTVRVIRADPRVGNAGAGNLSSMYFIPAELGGHRVRQLVQLAMPVSVRQR